MWFAEGIAWLGYYLFPTETGRVVVRIVSFGRVHCEDDLAWWFGLFFWLSLAVVSMIGVALIRRS